MLALIPAIAVALAAAPPSPWEDLDQQAAALQRAWGPLLAPCVKKPRWVSIDVSTVGAVTRAGFFPAGLGGRGPTAEEACLMKARLEAPPLPAGIERLQLRVWTGDEAPELFDAGLWKDPVATARRWVSSAGVAECADVPAELVVVFDPASKERGRAHLLGYQFEGKPAGLQTCLERRVAKEQVPPMPRGLGGLQVRVRVR